MQSSPPSAKPYPQERRPSGHQAALWNKGRGTRERTAPAQRSGSSERQQQGQNHRPCTRSPLPQAARSVMPCPCRPVVRGCRRSCERERERTEEGAGRHSLHLSESAVSIPQDGNRNGSNLPCGRPPPLLPGLCPKNAKRPPCGGPCILFPHPAGAGHGHRNYSALSALAGASVLASGRRVSSMMAMGALSPLRGMASFITRV